MLGWIGYDAVSAKAGQAQTPEVLDGIFMIANVVPGVGCILVGLALIFLYPLKKGRCRVFRVPPTPVGTSRLLGGNFWHHRGAARAPE